MNSDRGKHKAKQAGAIRMKKLQETNGWVDCVFAERANVPVPRGSMFCHQLATKADHVSETNFAKDHFQERY